LTNEPKRRWLLIGEQTATSIATNESYTKYTCSSNVVFINAVPYAFNSETM